MTLYAEHGQESVASWSSNSPSCVCIFLGKTVAHIISHFSFSLVTDSSFWAFSAFSAFWPPDVDDCRCGF